MVLGWFTLSVLCLFAGGVPGAERAARRNRRCVLSSPALRTLCRNPSGKAAEPFCVRFWWRHRTKRGQRPPRRCEIRSWDNQARPWASSLPSSSWSLLRAWCRINAPGLAVRLNHLTSISLIIVCGGYYGCWNSSAMLIRYASLPQRMKSSRQSNSSRRGNVKCAPSSKTIWRE